MKIMKKVFEKTVAIFILTKNKKNTPSLNQKGTLISTIEKERLLYEIVWIDKNTGNTDKISGQERERFFNRHLKANCLREKLKLFYEKALNN